MIPVNRPLITQSEIDAVTDCLKRSLISGDTEVIRNTEEALADSANTRFASLTNSGTSSIDMLIEALDVKQGDVCVMPTFTIISTATQLHRKGAILKLVDVDLETWCLDTFDSIDAITEEVRYFFPVHTYGMAVDVPSIKSQILDRNCLIIEDAAEALGLTVRGQKCGNLGDAGIFSFYANKIITSGEGGAVVTNNEIIDKKVKYFRNLCFVPEERFVHYDLGWNCRMSSLQAAMISSQLPRLEQLLVLKRTIAHRYIDNLRGHPWIKFQKVKTDWSENCFWVVGILLNEDCPYNAKEISKLLLEKGIQTRRFFCPLHLQPYFKENLLTSKRRFPNAETLWDRGIYLPSGLGTTFKEIDFVCEILWSLLDLNVSESFV